MYIQQMGFAGQRWDQRAAYYPSSEMRAGPLVLLVLLAVQLASSANQMKRKGW